MYKFWRCVAKQSIYINATRRRNEIACAPKPPVMQMVLIFKRDTWNSLITLVLPRGCCGIALPSWCCWNSAKLDCHNSAAKLAASWARFTKLAASMVQICQTCSKYGNPSHTWRISGSTRQHDHARKVFSLYCRIVEIAYQRLSANPQAGVLL